MRTELQRHLTTLAPSISIRTIWEEDGDPDTSIFQSGNALEDEDLDDWQCWEPEVRALVVLNGEEVTGSAYMSGMWEKYGDNPAKTNPEISGYENQMTQEALTELMEEIPAGSGYLKQFTAALEYLKAESRRSYEEQRATLATP